MGRFVTELRAIRGPPRGRSMWCRWSWPIWGRPGVHQEPIWGRLTVDPGSIWGPCPSAVGCRDRYGARGRVGGRRGDEYGTTRGPPRGQTAADAASVWDRCGVHLRGRSDIESGSTWGRFGAGERRGAAPCVPTTVSASSRTSKRRARARLANAATRLGVPHRADGHDELRRGQAPPRRARHRGPRRRRQRSVDRSRIVRA